MPTATLIRSQIEAALGERVPAPFAQKAACTTEVFPTHIPSVDLLLDGGIPRGHITEIAGSTSTGRTGLAFAAVATATSKGAACAWVDVQDALSPESAAAWGIDLQRLLWLRAGEEARPDVAAKACVLAKPHAEVGIAASCGGMHPRNETRNMDRAVSLLFHGSKEAALKTPRQSALLRDKTIGTPGASNRVLQGSLDPACAEPQPHRRKIEQIATDRLPSRRGDVILNKPVRTAAVFVKKQHAPSRHSQVSRPVEKPWTRLDQALRAVDLLLQAGGFGVVVLDMCDLRAEQVTRIPMATWYRFRLAAEQAQAAVIILAESSCAKSCAAFSLRCEPAANESAKGKRWGKAEEKTLFTTLQYRVQLEHKRRDAVAGCQYKKPVSSAQALWSSFAVRAR